MPRSAQKVRPEGTADAGEPQREESAFADPHRYGLPALFEELADQGVSETQVLDHSGVSDPTGELTYDDRIALLRSAQSLAKRPETALLAGQRQRISNFGAYGYALASSRTIGEAFQVGRQFFDLSGFVLHISLRIEDGVGIWRSHHPESLGSLLPFVAEYWRSSHSLLFSQVLGRPFPYLRMSFPYGIPRYGHLYGDILGCPIEFNSRHMEWQFDATVLDEPCADADASVAQLCRHYCEQFVRKSGAESCFQRELLWACTAHLSSGIEAPRIAADLNMSVRTFYRRLKDEGISFRSLVDRLLRAVAVEYLQNTSMSVEEIAGRCGYSDVSNFRKAFRRWTGQAPSDVRKGSQEESHRSSQ